MANNEDMLGIMGEMKITVAQAVEETEFLKEAYEAEILAAVDQDALDRVKAGVAKRVTARVLNKLDDLSDMLAAEGHNDTLATVTDIKDIFRNR